MRRISPWDKPRRCGSLQRAAFGRTADGKRTVHRHDLHRSHTINDKPKKRNPSLGGGPRLGSPRVHGKPSEYHRCRPAVIAAMAAAARTEPTREIETPKKTSSAVPRSRATRTACSGVCQNNGRPEMTDRRWRPDMTESPSTGSGGQFSVLCPDGPPVYRENLHPHKAVIQSLPLSIHIFQQCLRRRPAVFRDGRTSTNGHRGWAAVLPGYTIDAISRVEFSGPLQ